MKKNNSAGKPYYTQRNNKINPSGACNVTAMINALSSSGWPVEELTEEGVQPEDSLLRFIITDPVCEIEWKKLDPSGKYPPNEWHSILARGVNRWIARIEKFKNAGIVARFTENANAGMIADHIECGGNVVVSGVFQKSGSVLNHVFALVGLTRAEGGVLNGFTCDDSWGNFKTNFLNHDGNDVDMSLEEFNRIAKFSNNERKIAHFIRRFT